MIKVVKKLLLKHGASLIAYPKELREQMRVRGKESRFGHAFGIDGRSGLLDALDSAAPNTDLTFSGDDVSVKGPCSSLGPPSE